MTATAAIFDARPITAKVAAGFRGDDMRVWPIIGAALLLAACSHPPDAIQTASSAAHTAADQFATLAKPSLTNGQPPRQTDPAAGPLLDAIFNTGVLQSSPTADDLDAINDWLSSCLKAGQVYMLAGTGLTDINSADATGQAKIGQNLAAFAPEFGRFIDAELVIEGAEAASVMQSLAANPDTAKNPQSAQGFDKVRAGIEQTAGGVITTVSGPGLPNDWREARARSLLAFAARAAPFLNDAQKQALATAATQAAQSSDDPQLASLLSQFAAAIGAKPA